MSTLFINAKVILPDGIIENGAVRVDGEKIVAVYEKDYEKKTDDKIVDVGGLFLSPGFIDVHVHGADGGYFMSGEQDQIDKTCKMHMRHGTTAMTPSISAAPKEVIIKSLSGINEYEKTEKVRPDFLGLHLEGPYLSPNACGAMPAGYIREPSREEYLELLDRFPNIRRWALAPELPGSVEFVKECTKRGVLTAVGHSDAFFDDVMAVRAEGTNSITHFYSLTSTVRRKNAYRYAGTLEAGYLYDDIFVEVIADGCHLPKPLLQLIYKVKGPDRIMLITDGISASGVDENDGKQYYSQMGKPIVVEDGVAKVPSRECFAGSIATTDRLIRTMVNIAEVPLHIAVKMASLTPATYLGVCDKKGSIEVGKDADLLIFDEGVNVKSVYVRGTQTV